MSCTNCTHRAFIKEQVKLVGIVPDAEEVILERLIREFGKPANTARWRLQIKKALGRKVRVLKSYPYRTEGA